MKRVFFLLFVVPVPLPPFFPCLFPPFFCFLLKKKKTIIRAEEEEAESSIKCVCYRNKYNEKENFFFSFIFHF